MDTTLTDVAREVLDGPHIAAIATSNADGRPQSSLIFVKRDGDTVVFSTIKGRLKTRNMARDPRISLLVVDKEKARYVEIRGSVEITDDPEKRLLYEMYETYMGGRASARAGRRKADRADHAGEGLPVPAGRGMSDFIRDTEPFRRELLAHCYRMLGSAHDAEDVVQETYLRAWRGYRQFENRSSVRTWLYRIATNACLTALAHGSRRVLPSGLGGPTDDPGSEPVPAPDVPWLQAIPDAWVTDDPAAVVTSRENLRLALVASLQHLAAQPRAVLLLRDVLAFPAADVAAMLDISLAAVKSALQRARARLREVAPSADEVVEPTEPRARELLEKYMTAFENADTTLLAEALRHDAALEMVGSRTWFSGRASCLPFLAGVVGVQGDWRMIAIAANGQPAAAAYRRDEDGVLRAFGIATLDVTASGIARIVVFGDPGLVTLFGLPLIFEAAILRTGS